MFTDVINTLKFDITCSSETIASEIERIVVNDTMNGIAETLEQISIEYSGTDLNRIDKIEIDLGDITAKDLIDFTFSSQVRALFSKEFTRHQQHKQTVNTVADSISSTENSVAARCDLVKEFLVVGGLPWWADKNNHYVPDEILQGLLVQQPDAILPVLAEIINNAAVRYRLQTQFSSDTNKMINELLPFANAPAAQMGEEPALTEPETLASGQSLQNLLKATLSWLLARRAEPFIWQFISQLDNVAANEVSELKTFGASALVDVALGNKVQALLKLTLPQLNFLWQVVISISKQSEEEPIEGGRAILRARAKQFAALAKGLQIDEAELASLLQTFGLQQIRAIKKAAGQEFTEKQLKHQLAGTLAASPQLLQLVLEKISPAGLTARDTLTADYILSQEQLLGHTGQAFFTKLLKKQPVTDLMAAAQFAIGESKGLSLPNTAAETGKIIIENAGLCLLAPYLPALFKHLGYLHNNRFKTANSAYRALLLLQYATTGQKRFPEYTLQLNKLLCGIGPSAPIPVGKRLKAEEKQEANELLLAIINNWAALKNTSIEGVRSSFLQRKGLLFENEDSWTLQIEKKAYDVLLDSIPWAFNLIKLPWMKKAIQVEW